MRLWQASAWPNYHNESILSRTGFLPTQLPVCAAPFLRMAHILGLTPSPANRRQHGTIVALPAEKRANPISAKSF
jgi:hypothetical protein